MRRKKVKIPPDGFGFHEAANIFPMMGEAELQQLTDDIEKNGMQEIILVIGNEILDGRNRYRALERLGRHQRPQSFRDVTEELRYPPNNPTNHLDLVISKNLHRRHLNETQRAAVAVEVKRLEAKAAKERQAAGLKQGNQSPVRQNSVARESTGRADEIAADKLGVSRESIRLAENVLDSPNSTEELKEAVRKGEVAVSSAAVVAELPQEEQRKAVAGGKKGVSQAAKRARDATFRLDKEEPRAEGAIRRMFDKWPEEYHHIAAELLRQLAREIDPNKEGDWNQ